MSGGVDADTGQMRDVATILDSHAAEVAGFETFLTTLGNFLLVQSHTEAAAQLAREIEVLLAHVARILKLRAHLGDTADNGQNIEAMMLVLNAQLSYLRQEVDNGPDHNGSSSGAESLSFGDHVDSLLDGAKDWLGDLFEGDGLPFGEGPGEAGGPHFVIGDPRQPYIEWDEDFIYNSKDAGWRDQLSRIEWQGKLAGGRLLRSDLDDATQFYRHYWDNNGEHITFDYEEAYVEDANVRRDIDLEIVRAQQGAETIIADGNTEFSMTGDASVTRYYPETENWQKTIGGHQVWSSADVTVEGNTVTMEVVVHGEDYYNFNRGQDDIGTGASDDANGRFTEIGWAQPFPSSGEVTRTVTWTIGEAPNTTDFTESGSPERNPGREDEEVSRNPNDPSRTDVPANDRSTGAPRVDG